MNNTNTNTYFGTSTPEAPTPNPTPADTAYMIGLRLAAAMELAQTDNFFHRFLPALRLAAAEVVALRMILGPVSTEFRDRFGLAGVYRAPNVSKIPQ